MKFSSYILPFLSSTVSCIKLTNLRYSWRSSYRTPKTRSAHSVHSKPVSGFDVMVGGAVIHVIARLPEEVKAVNLRV